MESSWNHGWHGTQITRVACNKDPCNGENWCHMFHRAPSVRPVTRTSYWNLALPSRRPNRWLRNSWSSPWHTASERSPKIIEARPWKENKKSCCYSRYLRKSFKSVVLCYFPSILMSRPCLFQALIITFHPKSSTKVLPQSRGSHPSWQRAELKTMPWKLWPFGGLEIYMPPKI